uniref:Peptidase_M16 domain-containing protein n=1 Tax=Gongylonema pulchrum TaxID=637853 RepID=A0A183D820_9BILA
LEHLAFLGSKKYPYKGVLDLIANRCLASGTNAYTQQDHTGYELTTVGSQGFLRVLPVYLDHLLSPTLTDAQFLTEVHHINGNGDDAGVVYSEMQDAESDMDQIVCWKLKELFYPER